MLPVITSTLPEKNTQKDSDFFNVRSPEMYINMKPSDIPPKGHPDRKAFLQEERKKCTSGININGTLVVPSLYYDQNFHAIQYDFMDEFGNESRRIGKPSLRDNGWIMHNDFYTAKVEKKGYVISGARQISKSDFITSLTCRELFIFDNAEVLGLFSIKPDKETFNKKLRVALGDKSNPLIIPNIDKDLTKTLIRFGLTRKDNDPIILSQLYSYLTQEGKSTEVGAGKSTTFFFFDEIAKEEMREVWEAVKPALRSSFGGYRNPPIFAFTGGNVDKAQDALNMFFNPDSNDLLSFDTEDQKTGRFMDGTYRSDFKKEITLAEYLNKPDAPDLQKITIKVSDVERANKTLDAEETAARADKDPKALVKQKMYNPRKLEDMSLSLIENPFKQWSEELKKHQKYLQKTNPGKAVELVRDPLTKKVSYYLSDKQPVLNFPHKESDNLDAPVILYDDPKLVSSYKLHIGGLDPINVGDTKTSDSLASFYLLRRRYDDLTDAYQDTMVASYTCRPPGEPSKYLQVIHMLLDLFGATMLHEESNGSVLTYFDSRNIAINYLAKTWNLQREINPKTQSLTQYGLSPTPKNRQHALERVVEYVSEVIGVDHEGKPVLGLTRILDPLLIQEFIDWKDGLNVDRISAFGMLMEYKTYLDKYEKPQVKSDEPVEEKPKPYRKPSPWSMKGSYTTTTRKSPFKI